MRQYIEAACRERLAGDDARARANCDAAARRVLNLCDAPKLVTERGGPKLLRMHDDDGEHYGEIKAMAIVPDADHHADGTRIASAGHVPEKL